MSGFLDNFSEVGKALDGIDETARNARQAADIAIDTVKAHERRLDRIESSGSFEKIPAYVDVRDFNGSDDNERYEDAVSFILKKWGYGQFANPHIQGPGPSISGFGGTSQACLPAILFPAGHYDFRRTLWIHPQIEVRMDWNARWWFHDGVYIDDKNQWVPGSRSGTEFGHKVAIAVPDGIVHQTPYGEQHWMGYGCRLIRPNVKFLFDGDTPVTGIGIFGTQHNLEIRRAHLCSDTARKKSCALSVMPASEVHQTPWGRTTLSYSNGKDASRGFTCQLLDSLISDLFIEYWGRGPTITGIGNKLTGSSYYTVLGFHFFGMSPWSMDTNEVSWRHDDRGLAKNGINPSESLAGIMRRRGKNILNVASTLPVWEEMATAPQTRGLFTSGERLW